ncbi:MAG: glycosyltransferase [Phycisphaerales bacterium]|nr:glycosyltransferase family 2 protein [Planctomycetota bacterium]MCH8509203.1 glycosyltransferase [Phycisphaerales bacterium]
MDALDVTVIMPAYNAERWIGDAVRSVYDSGFARRLIVVDDGSDQPVERTLAPVIADAPVPTTVLRKPNGGEASARNHGIEHELKRPCEDEARCWVMFFDADDLLDPQAGEAIRDAQAADAGGVVGARTRFGTGDEHLAPPEDLSDRLMTDPEQAFRYLQVYASTGMTVRRDVLATGERWDERIAVCPDIEFLRRVGGVRPVWVSSKRMLMYRTHDTGANLSGARHADKRVLGFVHTVQIHHNGRNDQLLESQAQWLLNFASKHGRSKAAFESLLAECKARGWKPRLKPVARFRLRLWAGLAGRGGG